MTKPKAHTPSKPWANLNILKDNAHTFEGSFGLEAAENYERDPTDTHTNPVWGDTTGFLTTNLELPIAGAMEGGGRMTRRARRVRRELLPDAENPDVRLLYEKEYAMRGLFLPLLAGAIIGGTMGGLSKKENVSTRERIGGGATLGAGAGIVLSLLGMVGGQTLAAATPKRTLEQQARAERRNALWHYIPGVSDYERWKRIGASTHFEGKKPTPDSRPSIVRRRTAP